MRYSIEKWLGSGAGVTGDHVKLMVGVNRDEIAMSLIGIINSGV